LNDSSLSLGVNYTLRNLDVYVPAGNYTQVSVNQVNLTSDQAVEGKPAGMLSISQFILDFLDVLESS